MRKRSELTITMAPAWSNSEANPYTALLSDALVERGHSVSEFSLRRILGRRDVLHFHWPEYIIRQKTTMMALRQLLIVIPSLLLVRLRRTRIVWTVHNLAPHEPFRNPRIATCFFWFFQRLMTGFVSLSRAGVPDIEKAFPALSKKPRAIVPHATYEGAYPPAIDKQESRQRLGYELEQELFVFVGQIREYKNLPSLIEAFKRYPSSSARLHIAGQTLDPGFEFELANLAASDDRVRCEFSFVEQEHLRDLLSACDAVVLPYAEVFNSGSALLALTYSRPILVPRTAVFGELGIEVGAAWVQQYDPPLSASDFVCLEPSEAPDLSARTWQNSGRLLDEFYCALA